MLLSFSPHVLVFKLIEMSSFLIKLLFRRRYDDAEKEFIAAKLHLFGVSTEQE